MPAPKGSIVAGRRPIIELLRSGRPVDRVLVADGLERSAQISEIRKRCEAGGIPLRVVPRTEVDRTAPGLNHQGVAAITGRFRYTPLEQLLNPPTHRLLALDGVTDPHNLGSLLRSADGAGFDVVIPARRAVGITDAVRRVSAGASETVRIARVANLVSALDAAREAGLWILGLDEKAEVDLWSHPLAEPPVGLVLGAEDRGISPNVEKHCDGLARIPLQGRIGSLNVGVAGAVAMFEIYRRGQFG